MIEFIINKILVMVFIFAILNMILNIYKLIMAWADSANDEPVRYTMSRRSTLYFGISIAYVIASLFIGITY